MPHSRAGPEEFPREQVEGYVVRGLMSVREAKLQQDRMSKSTKQLMMGKEGEEPRRAMEPSEHK